MKRIGCILLILTIILTGCKTGNKNKNEQKGIHPSYLIDSVSKDRISQP